MNEQKKEHPLTLNYLSNEAYLNALDKGWHDVRCERSPLEYHALFHSEISEATEAVRNGMDPIEVDGTTNKPEGEAIELADVIIRIADYFGYKDWDLEKAVRMKMEYNKKRPHRHGGKLY